MTTAFDLATTLTSVRKGLREGRIEASWYQGRGAFGGLMAALAARAMTDEVADASRALRSLTVHFCAPATEGPFELATEIVRGGSRVSTALARVMRGGEVTTLATASFCRSRDRAERLRAATMPAIAPATELAPIPKKLPFAPVFLDHLDVRYGGATLPFSGASRAEVAAWVRLAEPTPYDVPLVAMLADSLVPALASTFTAPRALASVDFRLDFFARSFDLAPDEHVLVAITSRWADDGYTEELRDVWSPRGELLAQCRQLIALL